MAHWSIGFEWLATVSCSPFGLHGFLSPFYELLEMRWAGTLPALRLGALLSASFAVLIAEQGQRHFVRSSHEMFKSSLAQSQRRLEPFPSTCQTKGGGSPGRLQSTTTPLR